MAVEHSTGATVTTGMQARAAARGHSRVLRRSIVLLAIAMLGLAGVSTVLVLDASKTLQRVQRQAEFDSAVPTLRSIIETLLSAEAAQRAFLLTGHQNFLAPYADDLATLARHAQATQKLFPVDSSETRQLDRVGYLLQQKRAEMDQAVRVFQKGDSAGAVAMACMPADSLMLTFRLPPAMRGTAARCRVAGRPACISPSNC